MTPEEFRALIAPLTQALASKPLDAALDDWLNTHHGVGSATYQNLKAAGADLEKVSENYYGAPVTLASDVATAYVALRSAEGQLAVVENSLITRRETVQLTQWLEQAGTGDALDTQRSLTTLEQARTTMPALRLSIEQARKEGHCGRLVAGRIRGIDADVVSQQPGGRSNEFAVVCSLCAAGCGSRRPGPFGA